MSVLKVDTLVKLFILIHIFFEDFGEVAIAEQNLSKLLVALYV